jgi:phosphonate transport system permease protein
LVFGLAGAGNIASPWVRNLSRFLLTIERALPEIIILLLLVSALGLGPFAGVVALSLGCIGMLGRLFADAIEEINPRILESIESVGANKLQLILFGVIPEVLPSLIANIIFRFEVNIRLSVLLLSSAIRKGYYGHIGNIDTCIYIRKSIRLFKKKNHPRG